MTEPIARRLREFSTSGVRLRNDTVSDSRWAVIYNDGKRWRLWATTGINAVCAENSFRDTLTRRPDLCDCEWRVIPVEVVWKEPTK